MHMRAAIMGVSATLLVAALSGCGQASHVAGDGVRSASGSGTSANHAVPTSAATTPGAGSLPSDAPSTGATSEVSASASDPPSPSYAAAVSSPGTAADGQGQVHSKLAATAAVTHQLARLHLPPGAVLQHTAIPPSLREMGEGDGESQNVRVEHWYTVPGTPSSVLAYVKAHPPQGYQDGSSSGNADGGEALQDFDPKPSTHAPVGILSVGVNAAMGSTTVLLVVVQVDWLPPRTPLENIPTGVTSAVVHWQGPQPYGSQTSVPPAHVDRTLSGDELAGIVAALNGLETTSPSVHSCPMSAGESVTLTFSYAGHREVFTDGFSGCVGIDVTVDGVHQPQLSRSATWPAALHRALGITAAMDPAAAYEK